MKTIIFIIAISLFFACQKTCDAVHKINHSFAKGMESRWHCNYDKSKDLLNKYVDKTVCSKYPEMSTRGLLGTASALACDVIMKYVLSEISNSMAKNLDCDAKLVYADIKYGSTICTTLNMIPY